MENHPFIPPTPSPTPSASSYHHPVIGTDTINKPAAPVVDLQQLYSHLRSKTSPRPVQMSSNGSVNMSNESPIEVPDSPLPIPPPRTQTPHTVAMSPRTIQATLANHEELPANVLREVCKSLLATIAKRDLEACNNANVLHDCINDLERKNLYYEEIYKQAPEGFDLNDQHKAPGFHIPVGPGIYQEAKWVKRNLDGTVLGYSAEMGPSDAPFIIDLYAKPDYKYDEEAEPIPTPPMPAWFCRLLVGPTSDFVTLLRTSEEQLDWGLSHEITRYHDLDKEAHALSADIKVKHAELNALHQARDASEACLTLARAFEKVKVLTNLHRQGGNVRSAWKKRKNPLPRARGQDFAEQGCSDLTMG
jgi:hypothetical protein